MKKISIVVPTYRRPQLLSKCIDALLDQDFNQYHYEIIVVSDGPDAVTDHIIKSRTFRTEHTLRYCALFEKKGPAAARNKGWQISEGHLVAFTDDDCQPDRNWLKNIWAKYEGEELIAYSGKVVVPISSKPTDFELNTSHLERADFITANCCCTRKALELTGGFDERFTAAWREDSDLEFKLLQAGVPILKLENAVVVHPVRKTRWGVSIYEQKKSMFNALLYKKYPSLYKQKIQSGPNWVYYIMILSFIGLVVSAFLKSGVAAAILGTFWLYLTVRFISKRLSNTTREPSHVAEMIVTSLVIPFLSVYWRIYGAIKYRVLFF